MVLQTLTSRRWLTWLLVATLWAALCVVAALWQWDRWQTRSASQHRINSNYNAEPVPLGAVFTGTQPPAPSDQWKQVRASGRYVGETYLVRNRPNSQGVFGYEAINVFESQGRSILVDRGWVGNGKSAAQPESVPPAPRGEVTLVGWVMPSERSTGNKELSGQLGSISVADARAKTGKDLAGGYLRMRSETTADGATPPRPIALDKPSQGMAAGINLSYSIQWIAGLILGYWFVFARARREHLDTLALKGTAPAREPRRRRTRIWDEEDA